MPFAETFVMVWGYVQIPVYIIIVLTAILIFMRWRWSYMRLLTKDYDKKKKRSKTIEGIIDQKLNEIPGMLQKVNAEIAHLEKTHANEAQMKSLKDKRRLLELGQDYGEIAAEIGKPMLNTVIKALKGLG